MADTEREPGLDDIAALSFRGTEGLSEIDVLLLGPGKGLPGTPPMVGGEIDPSDPHYQAWVYIDTHLRSDRSIEKLHEDFRCHQDNMRASRFSLQDKLWADRYAVYGQSILVGLGLEIPEGKDLTQRRIIPKLLIIS